MVHYTRGTKEYYEAGGKYGVGKKDSTYAQTEEEKGQQSRAFSKVQTQKSSKYLPSGALYSYQEKLSQGKSKEEAFAEAYIEYEQKNPITSIASEKFLSPTELNNIQKVKVEQARIAEQKAKELAERNQLRENVPRQTEAEIQEGLKKYHPKFQAKEGIKVTRAEQGKISFETPQRKIAFANELNAAGISRQGNPFTPSQAAFYTERYPEQYAASRKNAATQDKIYHLEQKNVVLAASSEAAIPQKAGIVPKSRWQANIIQPPEGYRRLTPQEINNLGWRNIKLSEIPQKENSYSIEHYGKGINPALGIYGGKVITETIPGKSIISKTYNAQGNIVFQQMSVKYTSGKTSSSFIDWFNTGRSAEKDFGKGPTLEGDNGWMERMYDKFYSKFLPEDSKIKAVLMKGPIITNIAARQTYSTVTTPKNIGIGVLIYSGTAVVGAVIGGLATASFAAYPTLTTLGGGYLSVKAASTIASDLKEAKLEANQQMIGKSETEQIQINTNAFVKEFGKIVIGFKGFSKGASNNKGSIYKTAESGTGKIISGIQNSKYLPGKVRTIANIISKADKSVFSSAYNTAVTTTSKVLDRFTKIETGQSASKVLQEGYVSNSPSGQDGIFLAKGQAEGIYDVSVLGKTQRVNVKTEGKISVGKYQSRLDQNELYISALDQGMMTTNAKGNQVFSRMQATEVSAPTVKNGPVLSVQNSRIFSEVGGKIKVTNMVSAKKTGILAEEEGLKTFLSLSKTNIGQIKYITQEELPSFLSPGNRALPHSSMFKSQLSAAETNLKSSNPFSTDITLSKEMIATTKENVLVRELWGDTVTVGEKASSTQKTDWVTSWIKQNIQPAKESPTINVPGKESPFKMPQRTILEGDVKASISGNAKPGITYVSGAKPKATFETDFGNIEIFKASEIEKSQYEFGNSKYFETLVPVESGNQMLLNKISIEEGRLMAKQILESSAKTQAKTSASQEYAQQSISGALNKIETGETIGAGISFSEIFSTPIIQTIPSGKTIFQQTPKIKVIPNIKTFITSSNKVTPGYKRETIFKTTPIIKEEARFKQIPIIKSETILKTTPIIQNIPQIKTTPKIRTESIIETTPIIQTVPLFDNDFIIPLIPPSPVFPKLPMLIPGGGKGKGSGKKKLKKKYTPSLLGIAQAEKGIFIKKAPKGLLSGIGIRLVTKGFKLPSGFGGKK